eukprot:TRINITY_DN757_c0_g1_i11.p1 TRINITY_DN757_c0_g1~~TRINITY_DN757_c0_g1_i11.p1  ORF type:complete len:492 (+),score=111.45 TRINITY_DN757_c0_g1_i11:123-1598(+)
MSSFAQFKALVPFRQAVVKGNKEYIWKYYDHGDKSAPVMLCLPGASGTSDCYYHQILSLAAKGMRVISASPPGALYTHEAFAQCLTRFLAQVVGPSVPVHLLGSSLGGFLALHFAAVNPALVSSIVLCNSFASTAFFADNSAFPASAYRWMPSFYLKKMVLHNFPSGLLHPAVADSIDHMVTGLESLSQAELASRLTLNTQRRVIGELSLPQTRMTIIESRDDVAVPDELGDSLRGRFPEARHAPLKGEGGGGAGNFPYLSCASEFNLYLQIHLRSVGAIETPLGRSGDAAGEGKATGQKGKDEEAAAAAAAAAFFYNFYWVVFICQFSCTLRRSTQAHKGPNPTNKARAQRPPKSTLHDPSIDHARAQHRQYPSPPKRNVRGHPGPASKTQQATEIQQTPETQQAPEPQRVQHQRNHQHQLQHPPRRPSPPLRHPPPAAESAPCAPAAERPLHKSKQVAPGTAHAPGGSAGGRQASARTRHQRDSTASLV